MRDEQRAADEQPSANHKNQRESDFSDYQETADAIAAAAGDA